MKGVSSNDKVRPIRVTRTVHDPAGTLSEEGRVLSAAGEDG